MKVCIIGASGKLGQYMIQHCLARNFELTGVCRAESVEKLDRFKGKIEIIPGPTHDPDVIAKAMHGCDGGHRLIRSGDEAIAFETIFKCVMLHLESRRAEAVPDAVRASAQNWMVDD